MHGRTSLKRTLILWMALWHKKRKDLFDCCRAHLNTTYVHHDFPNRLAAFESFARRPVIAERFEFFCGDECANGFSELNVLIHVSAFRSRRSGASGA